MRIRMPKGGNMEAIEKEVEKTEVERTVDKPHYSPFVEIYEGGDGLHLAAEMPGVARESLDVTVDKGILYIKGESKLGIPDSAKPLYREFEEGVFYRAFDLAEGLDPGKIEAKLENGLLNLVIPKSEKARSRKIEVK